MTSTWRKDTKETFTTKKSIIEGATFEIFTNSYWNGKDQLFIDNKNLKILDIINYIRQYITSPLDIVNEATNELIFVFLSVFVEKDPACMSKLPPNIAKSSTTPLIDSDLLWLKEGFVLSDLNTTMLESQTQQQVNAIDTNTTNTINASNAAVFANADKPPAIIPPPNSIPPSTVSAQTTSISQNNNPNRGRRQQYSTSTSTSNTNANQKYIIGGVPLPHAKININGLQQIIAEFQQNHLDFMKDTDVYYSIRNKVATYYMQQISDRETKQRANFDDKGIFDFNNNFDSQLNDPIVQNTIKNISLDFTNSNILLYSINLDQTTGLQYSILQRYPFPENDLSFLNQIAIYLIQRKTNAENADISNYNFNTSYLYVLDNLPENIIKNINLPSDKKLWLQFKSVTSSLTEATANANEKSTENIPLDSSCNHGFSKKTYADLLDIRNLVKLQLINVIFIPMIVLIIYNIYYFLFYQDCYYEKDEPNISCKTYNEFPKLEEWIYKMLGITRENQPTFIFDFFLDLFFKPVKFIYTFFNSIKPTFVGWNNQFPYIFFVIVAGIITPLFMKYRDDIMNIISSILFLELPGKDYIWYSTAVIIFSGLLVGLQRIFGIAFIRDKKDPDGKFKPRLWSEWVAEKMTSGAFTAIACGIFTVLYWVFKAMATWSIISLSIYPIVIYILFIGLFGIWNNSKNGFNPQFHVKSGEKWDEINHFIFKKLLEKLDPTDNFIYSGIKNAAKNFLSLIILYLTELIIIGILINAMIQYNASSILSNYGNIRNILFISSAIIIGLILGLCVIKWFSTYSKLFEKISKELELEELKSKESGDSQQNKPPDLPGSKTFINIWKEALGIESFE